jgi:hypothetical protein
MKVFGYIFILFTPLFCFAQKKGGDCGCTKNSNLSNGYYAGIHMFANAGFYFNPNTDLYNTLYAPGGGLQAGINLSQSSSLQLAAALYKTSRIPASENTLFTNTFTQIEVNYSDIIVEWVKRFFLNRKKKLVPYITLGINNHISYKRHYKFLENTSGNANATNTEKGFLYYAPAFTFSGGINYLLSRKSSIFTGLRINNNLPATFKGTFTEGAYSRQIVLQAGINFHF